MRIARSPTNIIIPNARIYRNDIKFLIYPVNNDDINLVLYVQHNKNTRIICLYLSREILFI